METGVFEGLSVSDLMALAVDDPHVTETAHAILERAEKQIQDARDHFNRQVNRFEKGDDLPPGVLKLIKVNVGHEAGALRGG